MFPASVPVHAAAALTVTVTASVTSQIRIQGLYRATKAPELTPFSRNVAHSAGDRTSETTTIASNVQGDIVALSVDAVTAGIKRGTVYVVVQLASYAVTLTVARGYVYEGVPLVLGQFVEPGPGGGEGFMRINGSANPAAGAEIAAFVVPTNALWRPHSFQITMAQGITQTPHPALELHDNLGAEFAYVPIGADVAVSTSVRCSWVRGGSDTRNNVDTGSMVATMPEVLMPEGWELITDTQGIGANSDYGVGQLVVEEWLAPP